MEWAGSEVTRCHTGKQWYASERATLREVLLDVTRCLPVRSKDMPLLLYASPSNLVDRELSGPKSLIFFHKEVQSLRSIPIKSENSHKKQKPFSQHCHSKSLSVSPSGTQSFATHSHLIRAAGAGADAPVA